VRERLCALADGVGVPPNIHAAVRRLYSVRDGKLNARLRAHLDGDGTGQEGFGAANEEETPEWDAAAYPRVKQGRQAP
jgi:hypothetical protein